MPTIRPATPADADAIWSILEPVLRAGETYALPRDWNRDQALGYWFSDGHDVFVAEEVLAKHDENYMPPDAAYALKRESRNKK